MSEGPRRRRSSDGDSERNGGLPLFPLVVIVVFAGLLLGGLLAHFFGVRRNAPQDVAVVASPGGVAAVLPGATPAHLPSVTPARMPNATPARMPSATPAQTSSAAPGHMPSVTPAQSPGVSPSPSPKNHANVQTPAPLTTLAPKMRATASQPVTAATPVQRTSKVAAADTGRLAAVTPEPNYVPGGADQAAGIVRSYLGALARGDRATATTYLARGLPGEVFMDSGSRVLSLHAEPAGSQYRVTAEIATSSGAYYATFTLQSGTGGLQIVDHYAIKGH